MSKLNIWDKNGKRIIIRGRITKYGLTVFPASKKPRYKYRKRK